MRLIVEHATTREILTRDLDVAEANFSKMLSGPCQIQAKIPWKGLNNDFIKFKPYGHLIHVEETINGTRKILGSGIVQPSEVDDQTGDLDLVAEGFSNYPKGIPWLQNWNPITVDPFEIFHKAWQHIQSYPTGNLNVTITPESSGTYMLPGFSFDGSEFILDFFAFFLRSADMRDISETLNALARDIPFDYLERSQWNSNRTQIDKSILLGYPNFGVRQEAMVFRFGENAMAGKPKPEAEIEWSSEIIIKGWFPGKVYSSDFKNDDSDRLRRVIKEEDAQINSKERAKAWAKRKLTRRQVPDYWEELTVDANHPNAPFGQWDLGDEIKVEGIMPWVGKVSAPHRIIGYTWDGSGTSTLRLKHEGAFNYDPVEYES
ncbi:minor tail protein [Gordonia phage ParvusTarda]|uniref:Minor tail protein n=1 Tax=Gordonia phage ParvusTarda TaxID=2927261 RepID=A0A9E7U4Q9_9CAUD|nr:minor tail protein [Gordonia phage ParvusTarda]